MGSATLHAWVVMYSGVRELHPCTENIKKERACALMDCALRISPVTSDSGVKEIAATCYTCGTPYSEHWSVVITSVTLIDVEILNI